MPDVQYKIFFGTKAATREELGVAIRRALQRRPPPDYGYGRLPSAATEVLALAGDCA